jgi:hypothetical protein
MSVLQSQNVAPEFIKMRWMEPYVSAGINRKTFKTLPRGVYRGFVVKPGPGSREIQIVSDDPSGWGLTSGYASGAFDAASGWSIAVHESLEGFTSTIAMQAGVSANFTFDMDSYAGQSLWPALDVNYSLGYPTTSQIKIVDSAELNADPTLIVLGRVDVPVIGPINPINIEYEDPAYPRVLPYANKIKDGFMSREQAEIIELLKIPNASNAFEEEYEVTVAGPQTIEIPGQPNNIYAVGGNDMWVYVNGVKQRKGASRDYIEVDRGDGLGKDVTFVKSLKIGDRVIFRGQAYAVSLVNTLHVLDENTLVEQNVIFMNFVGSGVIVTPDGSRKVRITIPSVGGAGATKNKFNSWGFVIPAFRAVTLLTDGTVIPYDPSDVTKKFYGLTTTAILPDDQGPVILDGVVNGGGASVSGNIGDDVYVEQGTDGLLTTTVQLPGGGSVVRVGILDTADGVSGTTPFDIVFDRARLS